MTRRSDGEWVVHTHMGFERYDDEDEAYRRLEWLRGFFKRRSPGDFRIEHVSAVTDHG